MGGIPPSRLLNLRRWANEVTHGLGGWWTCYQFDSAITWFGRYIENKLTETETVGKETRQKYQLRDLLDTTPHYENGITELKRDFPHRVRRKEE